MKELIEKFTDNLREAKIICEKTKFSKDYKDFSEVLIIGMGGSGIGGKIVGNWIKNEIEIPILYCSDYNIPKFVKKSTLVIASSYSGNTEETISAVQEAKTKQAQIIAITSGGKLLKFCVNNNFDHILIPGGNPPRTQIGYSLVALLSIFTRLKLINSSFLESIDKAAELIDEHQYEIKEEAKNLAQGIKDKDIIIYSDTDHEAIAIRARQQFNENAKILCNHNVIPEMNHNELVGWAGGRARLSVLFLRTSKVHDQNEKRFKFSEALVRTKTDGVYNLYSYKHKAVEENLYLLNLIDWTSYYLAGLTDVDPVQIEIIDRLKSELNK